VCFAEPSWCTEPVECSIGTAVPAACLETQSATKLPMRCCVAKAFALWQMHLFGPAACAFCMSVQAISLLLTAHIREEVQRMTLLSMQPEQSLNQHVVLLHAALRQIKQNWAAGTNSRNQPQSRKLRQQKQAVGTGSSSRQQEQAGRSRQ